VQAAQTEAGSAEPNSDPAEVQTVVPPPSVLHEEALNLPPVALKTVRGHIKFAVRVKVDSSGNVVYASLASHSPSRYFTRVALDTARKWKFVSADDQVSRHWLLWFEFTRDGATTFQQRR
jgi:TonB family protein